jgi:hypothetical protein
VKIDEPLLTDVARTTGGRYFRARDAQALERIYPEIDQLERTPVRAPKYVRSPRSTAGRWASRCSGARARAGAALSGGGR